MLLLDYWRHSGVIVRLTVCFIFSIKSQSPWRLTKGNAEMRNMSKKTWKLRVWGHMTEIYHTADNLYLQGAVEKRNNEIAFNRGFLIREEVIICTAITMNSTIGASRA